MKAILREYAVPENNHVYIMERHLKFQQVGGFKSQSV